MPEKAYKLNRKKLILLLFKAIKQEKTKNFLTMNFTEKEV